MDEARQLLFDDPTKVYVALAAAEVVLMAMWYSRRGRKWAAALLIAPALAGGVALADALVVTDRERIVAALGVAAGHLETGDVRAAAACLAADCRVAGVEGLRIDREGIIQKGRSGLRRSGVQRIRLTNIEVRIEGANATSELTTRLVSRDRGSFTMGWRFQWARRASGWRIVRVEITGPSWLANWNF